MRLFESLGCNKIYWWLGEFLWMAKETTEMGRIRNDSMEEKQEDEVLVRMPDLLPDVIEDILSRLPVKPLIRFRCVSRYWCRLLSTDSGFFRKHLSRTLQKGDSHSLILHNRAVTKFFLIPNGNFEKAVKLDDSPKTESFSVFDMVGSSNGLVCLSCEFLRSNSQVIYLWNPATREYMTLPSPCYCNRKTVIKVTLGFGFHSVMDEYKVVRLVMFEKHRVDELVGIEAEIYSTNTDSWRKLGVFPYYVYDTCSGPSGVTLNGVVHWLASRGSGPLYPYGFILSFNMTDEVFREVPLPGNMNQEGVASMQLYLQEFKGCLSLFNTYGGRKDMGVWVMNEYNVKESWVKLFTIETHAEIRPVTGLMENGETLLYDWYARKLLVYNSESRKIKIVQFPELGVQLFVDAVQYVESLAPVFAGRNRAQHQQAYGLRSQKKREVEERQESERK